jgi:pimeloyl-ACP methyl ester carboxylesterase
MPQLTTDDGVRLYYEETGSGTPVVFVHEFADDYRGYEGQMRYFGRRYRSIAYNARGYPPSDVPEDPERYSQDRARDDIRSVLDALTIEKAHIVGWLRDAPFRLGLPRSRVVFGRRRLRLWRRARQAAAVS